MFVPDTLRRTLRSLRKDRGIKQETVAIVLGMTRSNYTKIESGLVKVINPQHLAKLSEYYQLSLENLITGPSAEPAILPSRLVPLISWIKAGDFHEPSDIYQPGIADEWISSNTKGENTFALRVVGDSMTPEFRTGDIIVVDPSREPQSGEFAVVKIDDEVTFKQVYFTMNKIILKPINEQGHKTIEIDRNDGVTVRIIGKVIEQIRKR
jgi:SOS-response transcriptional repressor LexA